MPVPRIAIVGRPNVGKSSLLNMLARDKVSIVDDTPGTTRDRVSILTDLPPPGQGDDSPDVITVEVTDTGVGMDAEALARIFEPYFSTKATGTGLGLTIARRNVELIGGTIAVRSERGVGTTVTMHLPTAE